MYTPLVIWCSDLKKNLQDALLDSFLEISNYAILYCYYDNYYNIHCIHPTFVYTLSPINNSYNWLKGDNMTNNMHMHES